MRFTKNLHWLIYLLFLLGACARQSAPTGGPKDTIPPALVGSNPKHGQTFFKGKTIELEFSEAISLNNAKEQLIITPSIGKEFKVEARRNKAILTYDVDLKDSTTYTFNFRESVQDITERNPVKNLQIAISTGSYVDSLTVLGNVATLQDEKPLTDVTVALQPYSDTFSILKHPATYFTKSDKKGAYKIENLKPGLYHVYAFTDPNKNLVVDSRTESYAFKRDSILLDTTVTTINLALLKLDARALKIISARPYNSYYNIRTSKNLKHFKIVAPDSADVYYAFGSDRANLIIYDNFPNRDSTLLRLSATDSIGNRIDTTLFAKFNRDKNIRKEKFDVQLKQSAAFAHRGIVTATFKFTKPLKEIDFDSLFYQIDSTQILRITDKDITYREPENELTITKTVDPKAFELPEPEPKQTSPTGRDPRQGSARPVKTDTTLVSETKKKPEVRNSLIAARGTFISIEQDSSKKIVQSIPPAKLEDLGLISTEVSGPPVPVIIQLVDTKLTVIQQAIHKRKASFEDLSPGDYQLRIILDTNGNGQWDPGNYLKRQEPEKIIYWRDEKALKDIKLKANFELGPLLINY